MNLLAIFTSHVGSSIKFKKPIDEQLVNKLLNYIQTSCKGLSKIIVGVDESLNSLLAVKLFKEAVGKKVIAMVLQINNPAEAQKAVKFCQQNGVETYLLDRVTAYQTEIKAYHFHTPADIRNFYHRFSSYHLLIQAEILKAKLVDTVDKSDRLLGVRPEGFYGRVVPFYSLYKSEVWDLAHLLGLPNQPIPTYQDSLYPESLTLSYTQIDPMLFLLSEKQLKPEEISRQYQIDPAFLSKLKLKLDKQLLTGAISQLII